MRRLARKLAVPAGATPYLDRTFTGWTAPASPGAPLFLHRSGLLPPTPCQSPGALPRFLVLSFRVVCSNPPRSRPSAALEQAFGPFVVTPFAKIFSSLPKKTLFTPID
jgi:hypothetical protein